MQQCHMVLWAAPFAASPPVYAVAHKLGHPLEMLHITVMNDTQVHKDQIKNALYRIVYSSE